MSRWMSVLGMAAAAALVAAPVLGSAQAQEKRPVKIGFVTTLTTPAAVIGEDMRKAVELAVEDIGGTMAGHPVQIIFEDDGFRPEVGKQKTDKLVKQDDVDFVTGFIWSHVLLASSKSALDSGKFLISSNAGPSQLAGEHCHKNFFSTSWQNDQTPMAMGEVLNKLGVKSLYIMAPNYAAGRDMVAGVERTFRGDVKGKDFTRWGADAQLDFSAELAKARASGAEALFVFYPGRAGASLVQQYQQAGLRGELPLYSVFTVDALSLPQFQAANMEGVLGARETMFWSPDLDTPQNRQFVTNFRKKYGSYPSFYAAQSYDTIFLIKSAVEAVGGNLDDIDGMRAAMQRAEFPSVRGKFNYGNNHIPIQNFYLREAVVDDEGNWTTKIIETAYQNHQDVFAKDCKM